jgi:hypothetical protein
MKLITTGTIAACFLACMLLRAEVTSRSKDIIVEQPQDLPEAAQAPGQSMKLFSVGNGRTYLYIEQQQLGRLAILDVTDPGHVKSVGIVRIQAAAPFDFVRDLGQTAALVAFRDNKGAAILDFSKPDEPTLKSTDALRQGAHTEPIGDTGFLLVSEPRMNVDIPTHDIQVIDSSDVRAPRVMATIEKVQKRLTNPDTGTTYLLGKAGLTVIRQPKIEEANHAEESYTN